MSTTAVEIPGYVAGTWVIDPVHSEVSFTVRHMMVSKVRGRFDTFEGTIVTAPDPLDSTVMASIDLSSVSTGAPDRDAHIRSADFFEVEKHPYMTFQSTGLRADGDGFLLDGNLTLKGVTQPITLQLEINGFGPDAYGGTRCGFSAQGVLNRMDFGVSFNGPIPGVPGGVAVSDKVTITLEVEGVLQKPEA
jgi:polyisoprenoid-binding protein YceI